MIFRALDIETVPDPSAWLPGRPNYRLVPRRLDEGARLLFSGTPYAQLAAEVGVEEAEPFPPPLACRVVAISSVDVGFDPERDPRYFFVACRTDCRWAPGGDEDAEERRLLSDFGEIMAAGLGVHLVTWNGRTFDLPVIAVRSLKHKLACGWYYANRDVRYRYTTEGHCDLMDFVSDFGASRPMRLGDFARLLGLPGKTDMSGDKVDSLYRRAAEHPGESDEIRARVSRYCLQDTLQTAVSWLRTRHLVGKLSAATHDAALETFRASSDVVAAIDVNWDRVRICPRGGEVSRAGDGDLSGGEG